MWMWLVLALAQDPALAEDPVVEPIPVANPQEQALADVQGVFARVERFDGVQIAWDGGVARLTGTVPSVAAREQAHTLAKDLPGTLFVDNLLTLEEQLGETPGERDDATEELLRRVFGEIDALKPVQVTVTSGVVQLSGTVLDSAAREQALALARSLDGVLYVEDAMTESTSVGDRLRPAVDTAWAQVQDLIAMTPLLGVALLVLVATWGVAKVVTGWDLLFRRFRDRPLLRATVTRAVRIGIYAAGGLVALELLDATALVGAVVGTAGVFGLALGFAFQDIVENYLAGILLSLQQPFGKDDLVEVDGVEGVVVRLTTRNTLLLTIDGNHVYLPNATVFKNKLTNYVRNPYRRFDFPVGVGVDEDLVSVIRTGVETLRAMAGVVDEPVPAVRIGALGDSTVVVEVFGWVDQRNHSFLAVRTEAIRRIKEAFDDAGYDMPEPIYRVHLRQLPQVAPKPTPQRHEGAAVDLSAESGLVKQAEEQRAREEGEDLLIPTEGARET